MYLHIKYQPPFLVLSNAPAETGARIYDSLKKYCLAAGDLAQLTNDLWASSADAQAYFCSVGFDSLLTPSLGFFSSRVLTVYEMRVLSLALSRQRSFQVGCVEGMLLSTGLTEKTGWASLLHGEFRDNGDRMCRRRAPPLSPSGGRHVFAHNAV